MKELVKFGIFTVIILFLLAVLATTVLGYRGDRYCEARGSEFFYQIDACAHRDPEGVLVVIEVPESCEFEVRNLFEDCEWRAIDGK